ncbi:MAG: metalloregulator ArsR/SmtB family transcription factor [Alphaproteobacteria bacterium]|nr:metalloregulator ArsR/SmtB family transcription factor [Alphaproteobacteria bacterium]
MELKQAAAAFAALSQETRVSLFRLLATAGATGMAAGELGAKLKVQPSTLSFHLATLEQAGLVQSSRRGRQMIYAVRFVGLRALLGYVTETCCAGRPELCGDLGRLLPDIDEEPVMTPAFNVLFLCTQNSARSIMAEAILRKVGRGRFHAYSAGSDPAPAPLPEVIDKLRSLGHDVATLRSKSWNDFARADAPRMDFIIALCDTPQGQQCPDFGDKAVTGAWPLPDPAKFTGSWAERTVLLNELYRGLSRRLEIFCSLPFATLDRMAAKARLDEIGDSTPVRA